MINNYKNIEFQLYGYLIQLRELFKISHIGEEEILKINENIKLIENKKFNVAVMGEFKRGKSSLINALLGMNILPSDVTPTTATINRITYGTKPSMTIFYNNETTEDANLNDISEYVTMLTEKSIKKSSEIREVVIQYPTVICQNNIDIIDTPGLNDNSNMTKITIKMLSHIDAVIVAISALSPFSEKEALFILELIKCENIENIFFVLTFIDQIDEDEQDKFIASIHERILKNVYNLIEKDTCSQEIIIKANRILDNSLILGVSSYLALKSFVQGDKELLKISRFENLKSQLYKFLTAEQGVNTMVKSIKNIENYSIIYENLYTVKINKLQEELNTIKLKKNIINEYLYEYKKNLIIQFKNYQHEFDDCLNTILDLNNIFYKNFSQALANLQTNDSNLIINILSKNASDCWNIANEITSKQIKQQIFSLYNSIINNFLEFRNSNLVSHINELNNDFGINLNLYNCFDKDISKIMTSFGFPTFKWLVSPIPSALHLYDYNLLTNIKYSINLSLEKYYDYWRFYINSSRNWWLNQADAEAKSISNELSATFEEIYTKKKNKLHLSNISLIQTKTTLNEIKSKTNLILQQIQ
ncbi:MAG: dynamin family protein [Clostridiaceae bacterium]